MWIAKNSITGKTYGKTFNSIYDCQKYIDNELIFLQYEWKQISYLEKSFDNDKKYKQFLDEKYPNGQSFVTEIFARMEYALQNILNHKDFEGVHGQNVIRCWYVEQKRFADSMDF